MKTLIILVLSLVASGCSTEDKDNFKYAYTYEDLHKIEVYSWPQYNDSQRDSIRELVEQIYILHENWDCGTVTQSQIDSIETKLL